MRCSPIRSRVWGSSGREPTWTSATRARTGASTSRKSLREGEDDLAARLRVRSSRTPARPIGVGTPRKALAPGIETSRLHRDARRAPCIATPRRRFSGSGAALRQTSAMRRRRADAVSVRTRHLDLRGASPPNRPRMSRLYSPEGPPRSCSRRSPAGTRGSATCRGSPTGFPGPLRASRPAWSGAGIRRGRGERRRAAGQAYIIAVDGTAERAAGDGRRSSEHGAMLLVSPRHGEVARPRKLNASRGDGRSDRPGDAHSRDLWMSAEGWPSFPLSIRCETNRWLVAVGPGRGCFCWKIGPGIGPREIRLRIFPVSILVGYILVEADLSFPLKVATSAAGWLHA